MLHRIEEKIKSIKKLLAILEDLKPDCEDKFLDDIIYQGALLHYLYLVSDSSIALAEMIIKHKKLSKSTSYYESIDVLGEHNIIPAKFAYDFAKIASFRNFLAHHYEKIDYKEICENTLSKLDEVKEYIGYIEESLKIK